MNWFCEPKQWSLTEGKLEIVTDKDGDFWRTTHYGFVHDNGHFFYDERSGDFTASVSFEADYERLYDQAGLMIRVDEHHWIKAGIEFVHGHRNLSVVATNETSDWSVQPWTGGARVWLQFVRKGDAVAVLASEDGEDYRMIRLAFFPPAITAQVGPMTCSPTGEGLRARFAPLQLSDAIEFDA